MATTGKIFYNAIRQMSREQLINYIDKYADPFQMRGFMNICFEEVTKMSVLEDEMIETCKEVEGYLNEEIEKQTYLKRLELRIKMLILSQHMAKNVKDERKMFSNSQRITELFTEYQLEGGTRSFQSPH